MKKLSTLCFAALILMSACNGGSGTAADSNKKDSVQSMSIKELDAHYKADSVEANSYVAYDESIKEARPVVLIIPEWWGLTEYAKRRAREVAALGYFAIAVDMYGNRATADDPGTAGKMATPFYADENLFKNRISAALAQIKSYPQADANRVGIMGYCFGGHAALLAAKLGLPVKAAVSFHGNLAGTAPTHVPVLVLHGEADSFVPVKEVDAWKKTEDSAGAHYTFKSYPDATHAFTNPGADTMGTKFKMPIRYNAVADTASWNEMVMFFKNNL